MGIPHGLAEGGGDFSSGMGVVSGVDDREGESIPYVNQFCVGLSGGPGTHDYDGWLTYEAPNGGGVLVLDSIEVDEAQYPVLMESRRVAMNSMGAGRWNGAPATEGAYRSLSGNCAVFYCSDGDTNPAQGVFGGHAGAPSGNWRRSANGDSEPLPSFHEARLTSAESIVYRSAAGGGYGEPEARNPQSVAEDVNRKWLSEERAKSVYKVALLKAANGIDFTVNEAETRRLRDS
jgi:N-methylhydantoinase B